VCVPQLTELGLSNNRLEMLPPSLGHTPLLKLTLEGNSLKRPPRHLVFKGPATVQSYLAALESAEGSASLDLSRSLLADCPLPLGPRALPQVRYSV
jgi:Leucine-rich repeat (LRR) protein